MKRYLFLLLLLSLVGKAYAEAPLKQGVVIDYFTCSPQVPVVFTETIRGGVIAGFLARGRHEVIDAQQVAELPDFNRVSVTDPAELLRTGQERLSSRIAAVRALGARYIVTGAVSSYLFKHEPMKGADNYTSSFSVSLIGYDVMTGETIGPTDFLLKASGPSAQVSDGKAMESLVGRMEWYIDSNFKFRTGILDLGEPNAKGKLKTLYIGCGSAMGVHPGDLFMVYRERNVGGETAREKIGKLRAKQVQGEAVTECTVSGGGAEIAEAFRNGETLIVLSDGQAFF